MQPLVGCAVGLATLLLASSSRALPQVGAGITTGAGSVAVHGAQDVAFHAGLRGDVLFLRERERDVGVGLALSFESEAVATASFQGGAELLVPAWADIPFVFTVGGLERTDGASGYQPGVFGSLFWGSRSYNFEQAYGLGAGVFVEARHGLGSERDTGVIAGVSLDLTLLAYPALALLSAFR